MEGPVEKISKICWFLFVKSVFTKYLQILEHVLCTKLYTYLFFFQYWCDGRNWPLRSTFESLEVASKLYYKSYSNRKTRTTKIGSYRQMWHWGWNRAFVRLRWPIKKKFGRPSVVSLLKMVWPENFKNICLLLMTTREMKLIQFHGFFLGILSIFWR